MLFKIDNLLALCNIVFDAFIEKWNLTYPEMGKMVERFRLATFVEENEEYLNSMGVQGIVEELEEYIKSLGGALNGKKV